MESCHNNMTNPLIISQSYHNDIAKKYTNNKQKYTNTKHPKPKITPYNLV